MPSNQPLIAPSLLSANFLDLASELDSISSADWLHFDVMDGSFVPNLSFGVPILEQLRKATDKHIDVHLMVQNPEVQIPWFIQAGADSISFHAEAATHAHRAVSTIKEAGKLAGMVLNPGSSLSLLDAILPDLDFVLLMSVNPGFGGQRFIASTLEKVAELRRMAEAKNPQLLIEVDGGVDASNAAALIEAGANVLVAGSSVFKSENRAAAIKALKEDRA